MRQFLLAFLSMVLFSAITNAQTVQRTVLVEQFTNASCPPCAVQNPAFNNLLSLNATKVAVIKYQTDWPGYDPMNEQNPGEVQTRVTYYGVTGVPNVRIDGTTDAGTAGQVTQAKINTAYAVPARLVINLTHSLSADLSTITINCDITNTDTLADFNVADARLRLGIIEKDLFFPEPPGSTDETHFNYVMRKMLPDAMGTLAGTIPAGATMPFTWTVDLPDYIYNYTQLGAVAFVQSHAAKTVYQAAISQPVAIPGYLDAGFTSETEGNSGLCDNVVTPKITVTNEGEAEITSFDASYSLNGGTPVTVNWTGALAASASQDVTFSDVTLAAGTSSLQYAIGNVNNGSLDLNSLNNLVPAEEYGALSIVASATEIQKGFEADNAYDVPAGTVADRADPTDMMVVDAVTLNAANPIGGFATSDKSLLSEVYNMLAGVEATLTFDKVNWTDLPFDTMTFDVAYRQYQAETDRLLVEVSTDCGTTWKIKFDKQGAALATTAANTAYFRPTAAMWRTETVDLSEFGGEPEVIVRLHVISAYGNNMFFDNINITGEAPNALEDVIAGGKVSVYPNPASGPVRVDFSLAKANDLTVAVYDLTGRLVETLVDNASFTAGDYSVEWGNGANAGLYLVKIKTEEGEVTRRVSVVK